MICFVLGFILGIIPQVALYLYKGVCILPNIQYKVSEKVKVVRVQDGLGDLFPKYELKRKINGIWYRRAETYCSIHRDVKDAIEYLLSKEESTFVAKKFYSKMLNSTPPMNGAIATETK